MVITPAEYRVKPTLPSPATRFSRWRDRPGPSSFSKGQNYVVYNYFKLNSLAYISNDETFNTTYSFGSLMRNQR